MAAAPQLPPQPPRPPLPRWFWITLSAMVLAMIASLLAAVLLPTPTVPPHPVAGHAAAGRAESHPLEVPAFEASEIPSPSTKATEYPDQPEAQPASEPQISPTTDTSATSALQPRITSATNPPVNATTPLWQSNSKAPAAHTVSGPKLAILIDDMGLDPKGSEEAMSLPAGISFSFLSFGPATHRLAPQAFENGHEILIHVPMEPLPHPGKDINPGPDTLDVGDTPAMILAKLNHHLAGLSDIAVGVNNHTGSRFTAWPEGMRTVLQELDAKGFLFLDSLTISPTATHAAAQGLTLPLLRRDVFLDHDETPEAINRQLDRAIALAQKQGFAIAIGHPLSNTLAVLESRLPQLTGVTLVPVTTGIQKR